MKIGIKNNAFSSEVKVLSKQHNNITCYSNSISSSSSSSSSGGVDGVGGSGKDDISYKIIKTTSFSTT